jgi:hypothetical protein
MTRIAARAARTLRSAVLGIRAVPTSMEGMQQVMHNLFVGFEMNISALLFL